MKLQVHLSCKQRERDMEDISFNLSAHLRIPRSGPGCHWVLILLWNTLEMSLSKRDTDEPSCLLTHTLCAR